MFVKVNRAFGLSIVSRLSFDFEDFKTDHLLAAVDDIDIVDDSQPWPSPKLSDTAQAPTQEASNGTKGIAHRDSSGGELLRGRGRLPGAPS